MMTADGQWVPDLMNIELSDGDWIWGVEAPAPLPDGAAAWIIWQLPTPVRWDAVIDGRTVSWRQDKATTTAALIPQETRYVMWLSYPNENNEADPDEYVWKHGRAMRTPKRT